MLIGFGIDFDYKQSTFKLVIKKLYVLKMVVHLRYGLNKIK